MHLTLIQVGGWGEIDPHPALVCFSQKFRNGKSCNAGIQRSVRHYQRRSCQICYSLPVPIPRYWAKLRGTYFRSLDSGQSPINRNCHNSRTTGDIDLKLGPVTKLDKRNKKTSNAWLLQAIVKRLSSFGKHFL